MFSKYTKKEIVANNVFKKNKSVNTAQKVKNMTNNAPSIIGADVVIIGNIITKGEIQLDGKVEGDIQSTSLTIGESGMVSGSIKTEEVTVKGQVKGKINGRSIRLEKTSKVTGDLNHESLSIEAGAFIEGSIKHNKYSNTPDSVPSNKSIKTILKQPL